MRLLLGDCLEVMRELDDNSIDTIITDPPYGLEFMGKDWDKGVPGVHFWSEMLRVAKPGATLMAMGGTRTYHRLASAIEDAGWRIIDMLEWLYGSGFPKSYDIGKKLDGWEGWGTALKPAHEPICVAYKPREGTYVNNALKWGVAGLNIDGSRVPTDIESDPNYRPNAYNHNGHGSSFGIQGELDRDIDDLPDKGFHNSQGRFPANVIHDGSDEVLRGFPDSNGSPSTWTRGKSNKYSGNTYNNGEQYRGEEIMTGYGDSGSAARFFYTAKASRSERNAGLEGMEEKLKHWHNHEGRNPDNPKNFIHGKNETFAQNHHPTVKPIELMRYLVRLTKTPTGGVVLDPFMGSGTTGIACVNEGRDFIGIEQSEEYFEIARRRIEYWQSQLKVDLPLLELIEVS